MELKPCPFCGGDGGEFENLEDEYGEWKLELVSITPLRAINLTTGKKEDSADPPYHSLFLKYLDEENGTSEHGSFPIKYCPVCGAKLKVKPEEG